MIFSSIPPKFYEKPGGIDDFLLDSARIFRSNSLLYVPSPRGRVILSGQPNPWISRSNVTGINRFPVGMERRFMFKAAASNVYRTLPLCWGFPAGNRRFDEVNGKTANIYCGGL
jgi:hypothetical protein